MAFVGYRIKGIDAKRVPAEYNPNEDAPLAVYLELEWNTREFDDSMLTDVELNADLIALWIDKFKQGVDAWLQEDDDIVMPDDIHPKIEYDNTKNSCLRVEGITLDAIEGIANPLQGFINYINEEIANELDRRQEFREHVEHINSEYFGTEED